MFYYTGVGSRNTPKDVLVLMGAIATKMAHFNYGCRTGDAPGADKAFRDSASGAGVFTNNQLDPHNTYYKPPMLEVYKASDCTPEAMTIAARFHPAWHKCSAFARKLHGRNAFQILGLGLNDPSKYCICWTPDGCISHATRQYSTGGTGTAISIADAYKVPVINLAIPSHRQHWTEWLNAA